MNNTTAANPRIFFVKTAGLLALVGGLLLSACDRKESKSLLEGQAAAAGVKDIVAKLKPPVRALSVDINSSTLTVQVQDPSKPSHVDAWTYSIPRGELGWFGASWTRGPEPVELNLINGNLEDNLFNLDDVDFSQVAKTSADAVKAVEMEDPAEVTSIHIRRRLYILPAAHSGPVEWTLEVRSGRESAEVYADAKGQVHSKNVAQTRKAQTLDLLAGGQPLTDAITKIRDTFGAGTVIRKASFSKPDLTVVARKSGEPAKTAETYRWNLNGLVHVSEPMIHFPGQEPRDEDFFAMDDVDWTQLTKLIAAASAKIGLEGGSVTNVEVGRREGPLPKRPVEWRISIQAAGTDAFAINREQGTAYFSGRGELVRVDLPKGRRKAKDFLGADNMKDVLPALRENFGENARYMELRFDDHNCYILAPGPKSPGKIQMFNYDQDHFSNMPAVDQTAFYKGFKEDWMFTLEELGKVALPVLEQRKKDTLARLRIPDGHITRITFQRNSPFHPENKKILTEIRAEAGAGEGYVVFDESGAALDVITP